MAALIQSPTKREVRSVIRFAAHHSRSV